MLHSGQKYWVLAACVAAACTAAWYAPDHAGRCGTLAVALLVAVMGWLSANKRFHLIADIPTSLVASAAQGYVELTGICTLHAGTPALGFSSGPPCVWQRYRVYEKAADGQRQMISSGQSTETFLLRDTTGTCVIDPEGAEIVGTHHKSWVSDGYTYDIDYLAPGDTLYALGILSSQSGIMVSGERRHVLSALLAEWKRDRATLLDRFDSNGDGELDLSEWEAVRAAADAEVAALESTAVRSPDLHVLHRGTGEQPYILSNHDPSRLAWQFRLWGWVFGVSILAMAIALVRLQS